MDAPSLERYLHEHIPLSRAMEVEVVEAGPGGVRLSAPLSANLNHRDTAFGGSVAALAILAGWASVMLRLRAEGVQARTVIQRSDVTYLRPVLDAFEASAEPVEDRAWERFRRGLERWGRARVRVVARVSGGGEAVAELDGDYVSLL